MISKLVMLRPRKSMPIKTTPDADVLVGHNVLAYDFPAFPLADRLPVFTGSATATTTTLT